MTDRDEAGASGADTRWRRKIREKLAKDRLTGPVFGDDAEGNYCRFDPDGSKAVLTTAAEQAAHDRAVWGAGG